MIKSRLKDLADRSYNNGVYTFSDFLGLQDISEFMEIEREVSFAGTQLYGGNDACERKMVRFGSEESLGYKEEFPIDVLKISPLMDKFSDDLTHRDFLGALMNLGIERDKLGDIFVKENKAYVYCLNSLSEYIVKSLTKVKHTSVKVQVIDNLKELPSVDKHEVSVSVASERIDGVVAKVYNLSRNESAELFVAGKIFLNGRLMENESRKLVPGDVVSVRGFGRFEFVSLGGLSKKGKQYVTISVWG